MASVVIGQLVGIPTPIAATFGMLEGILFTCVVSIVAERVLFRMPRD